MRTNGDVPGIDRARDDVVERRRYRMKNVVRASITSTAILAAPA
jgi:hypothetical protein